VDIDNNTVSPPSNATNGNPICGGVSILWTPPVNYVGLSITYQCFVHDNMGWVVTISNETICDKYTDEFETSFGNNAGLINGLVGMVLDNLTNPTSELLDYFDGAVPANSTDYTSPASAPQFAALQTSLVEFFAGALGCSDGSIGPYTGPSLKAVHADMPIGGDEYNVFVDTIASVATSLGMSSDDVNAVGALLNSLPVRGAICNFNATCVTSLCNKYSNLMNLPSVPAGANLNLMTVVVNAVIAAEVTDPLIGPFFNGTTPPGSIDFLPGSSQSTRLTNALIAFFGGPDALGCTDPAFPNNSVSVPDLKAIHQFMPITTQVFNRFNDIFDTVLANLSVSADDIATIRGILNSTEPLICNQPGCSTVPLSNSTGTTTIVSRDVLRVCSLTHAHRTRSSRWPPRARRRPTWTGRRSALRRITCSTRRTRRA
jgi:truncated hemoglobin YjbI